MAGLIEIDHRNGQGLDGKQGKLVSFDTRVCIHCQGIIALLKVEHDVIPLANINLALATPMAKDLPANYTHKFRCPKCNDNICRKCAGVMEVTKTCPGPWYKVLDGEYDQHQYGQIILAS